MDASRDKNLLLGILAVQLKGVTPAQLVEAAAAWATNPSVSLDLRLIEMGVLTPRDSDLLKQLVEEAIQAHGGDAHQTLASFGGEEQVKRAFGDSLSPSDLDNMKTAPMEGATFFSRSGREISGVQETPGRYSLVSSHAKGGMGRVLIVHDEYLGRNIALKELLPVHLQNGSPDKPTPVRQSAAVVARFLQEARITGQLDHPAIVPVYEVGRRQDGTLYYTMRLVRGKTFAQKLKECEALPDRLKLLTAFVNLCQAIAYAHSRGVIHRDVKPGNVMLGEFGETVVLDWGLAKARDIEDVNIESIRDTLHFLEIEGDAPLPETAYGRALGTPHYMPPEQAEGRIDAIDERSDVYSLGAVLYEILTGTTPHAGKSTREILHNVTHAVPVPALEAAPDVPPELAVICEKALQKDSASRYQTASELADEVQRFITGSLVHAYSYSIGQMLRYYYHKHRGLVNTVAAALAIVIGVGIYSYVSILQARDREHVQRLAAEDAQRSEAAARQKAERAGYITQLALIQRANDAQDPATANAIASETLPSQRNWEWGFLLNQANPELLTIRVPKERIVGAAITPDSAMVATFSDDGNVAAWDLNSGALKLKFEPKDDKTPPASLPQFSADGTRLVAAGQDTNVRVWDVASGKLLHVLKGHTSNAVTAEFSPDGKQVISTGEVGEDGSARIWDVASGNQIAVLDGGGARFAKALFCQDAAAIVTVSRDGQVRAVNRADMGERCHCPGADAVVSRDNRFLAAVKDGTVSLLDLATGASLRAFDAGAAVNKLRFSRNGERILVACSDGNARLWETATGRLIRVFSPVWDFRSVPLDDAFFGKDEAVVICAFRDNTFAVWDAASGFLLNRFSARGRYLESACVSADGLRMATTSGDECVQIWDPLYQTGRRLLQYGLPGEKSASYRTLASCEKTKAVAAYESATGLLVFWAGQCSPPLAYVSNPVCMVDSVHAAFSPDGSRTVATLDPFTPAVWGSSFDDFKMLAGHQRPVRHVEFDPSGQHVLTASADGTARIWDAESGEPNHTLAGHSKELRDARYSPDGKTVVTASLDGTAIVWDAESGSQLRTLQGHEDGVLRALFSRDGQLIFTASMDKTLRTWDVATGTEKSLAPIPGSHLSEMKCSPDGRVISTCSDDAKARFWDTGRMEPLFNLANAHSIEWVGLDLVTSRVDGRIELWQAVPWKETGGRDETLALFRASDYEKSKACPIPEIIPAQKTALLSNSTILWSLKRLHTVLQAEQDSSAAPGVVLAKGPRIEATALFTLQEGDILTALNGRELADKPSLLTAIDGVVSDLEAHPNQVVEMAVLRQAKRCKVRIVPREARDVTCRKTLSREEAAKGLAGMRNDLLADASTQEFLFGAGGAAMKAMGAGLTLNLSEGNPLVSADGLVPEDRLVKIDGNAVSDYDNASKELQDLAEAVAHQKRKEFTLDTQRGEFIRGHFVFVSQ